MNLTPLFFLAASLSIPLSANAQEAARRNLPNIAIGNVHRVADSSLVGGFNLGLVSDIDTLHGFQMALLYSRTRKEMRGFSLSPFVTTGMGRSRGFQVGGLVNGVGGEMKGGMLSTVVNVAHAVRGLQLAGFSNIALTPMRGLQVSAITNIAMGVKQGTQVSLLANISAATMRGVQAGAYNYADTLNGSQLGIINVAATHPEGVQVGVFNYTRDTTLAHKIGLINVNPLTHIDYLLSLGNTSKLNVALRFRNRSAYTIVGFGTHYMGLDRKFSGALYYRLGRYVQLAPCWGLSGDVGYYHIETFEQHSTSKPQRLFSLQARVNLDYQVSPALGLFASLGYGDTRYYHHHREYENKLIAQVGLSLAYNHGHGAHVPPPPTVTAEEDSLQRMLYGETPDARRSSPYVWDGPQPRKRYGLAAAETMGINMLVFSFDRFVMNEDFSQVNIHTIAKNLRTGFVWDNDPFATNLFAHPYHGNLYFNSARSNGLSFWQSVPYAIGGSLTWELFAECEPPAINDWMATSLGGSCIGEMTNRISHLILNDSKRGMNRFLREAAAFLIDPIQGFNRILHGDAWDVRTTHYRYHDYKRIPVELNVTLGNRYLADDGGLFRGEHNPYVNVYMQYGDAFNGEENKPYDYFTAQVTLGLSGNQPMLNAAHLLGRLWGTSLTTDNEVEGEFGLFQHFNFYNSEAVKDGTSLTPYRISEAVGLGPGLIYRFPSVGNVSGLKQSIFVDFIMLGGSKSDYYNVIDRDYNMGSGYSFKSKTVMEFPRMGFFAMNVDYYRIYTWKGWENKDLGDDPLYYNVQGDKSNAELFVVNPLFVFNLKGALGFETSGSYFIRHTRYKYHADVRANTFEFRAGLIYRF